jgi:nitronate monooxygenase
LGTAFLRTPQCGAHPLHKAALIDPRFPGTTVTQAFTGRPARALANRFTAEHDVHAPAAYPQIHHLTKALRQAAAAAGDPDGMALWAGQGHRSATDHPAGQLVTLLTAQAADAHAAAGHRLHRTAD